MDKVNIPNRFPDDSTVEARERQVRRWRKLRRHASAFVASLDEVPPFPSVRLIEMADRLSAANELVIADPVERTLLAIMIHNEAWRPTLAGIPFERRLLLLPQCLRTRDRCAAGGDAYGLLCDACGQCPLGALQREAEDLGYAVLIAEGTSAAIELLRKGNLEAVIGVSCLPALEKTFEKIAEEAVPAAAIPLLRNGCDGTDVDLDWLTEHIRLCDVYSGRGEPPLSGCARSMPALDDLRARVQGWFAPESIRALLGAGDRHASNLAAGWLSRSGKRWRPLLTAAAYDALRTEGGDPALIRAVAVATECFHKASLIHDDIEDGDDWRDGAPTLHRAKGIAAALNVGDLLLGEGYAMLSRCGAGAAVRLKMLDLAADAHRRLCIGQGEELHWMPGPGLPDTEAMLRIFRHKTAPAFEVAILLGAIAGGADDATCAALTAFSEALGIAYQIRDDRHDLVQDIEGMREGRQQPSILLALLFERCDPAERETLREILAGRPGPDARACVQRLCARHGVLPDVKAMEQDYRRRALDALAPLRSIRLKSMMLRLVKRILPAEPADEPS